MPDLRHGRWWPADGRVLLDLGARSRWLGSDRVEGVPIKEGQTSSEQVIPICSRDARRGRSGKHYILGAQPGWTLADVDRLVMAVDAVTLHCKNSVIEDYGVRVSYQHPVIQSPPCHCS